MIIKEPPCLNKEVLAGEGRNSSPRRIFLKIHTCEEKEGVLMPFISMHLDR